MKDIFEKGHLWKVFLRRKIEFFFFNVWKSCFWGERERERERERESERKKKKVFLFKKNRTFGKVLGIEKII